MRPYFPSRLFSVAAWALGVLICSASPLLAADAGQRPTPESVSHYTMGLVNDWNGFTEDAIKEYEQAAKYDSKSYIIHLRLGADYARVGKLTEAIAELKLASEVDPQDLQTHYLLALIYSTQQEFDKAAEEYEIILTHFSKSDPQNVEVYSYLGQLYYSEKKYDKAIEQFMIILKLEPKNVETMFVLGSLYLERNDRPKAVEYLKNAIAIDPEHENSLNSLGYIYAEDGTHLDEAVDLIKKALAISPDNGAYLDSLGWAYYKKGMNKEALENLQKASTLFTDPVIYEHLGDVYYAMQQNENAEKSWKESLKLLPGQEQVQKKLEALKKGTALTAK